MAVVNRATAGVCVGNARGLRVSLTRQDVQTVMGPRGSNGTAANLEATGTRTRQGETGDYDSMTWPKPSEGCYIRYKYVTRDSREAERRERVRARARTGPRGDVW